ncbi:MAG: 23S rRNA (guanosine(2251)-2'-O)-methyltransferase RlmB [Synechococcaceae cyanobacterium]|nr:23S rRNA (guanosine(2251)-2'-O)-methyltransferase RlmB [Synechococcaceae cyanobacterium]
MSHPSDRRSDGPASRRLGRRLPESAPERSTPRRPEERGGSTAEGRFAEGRFSERRRGGPQERPFRAGAAGRWAGPTLRDRRPGAAGAAERPASLGSREGNRPERPGPMASGRRSFRERPVRGSRGEFGAASERRGGVLERRGAFRERLAAGGRGGGEDRSGERRPGGERWPAGSPGSFPGSRRPDRPARPGPLPQRRPSLTSPIEARPAMPAEIEADSHAPAAPSDLIWGRHSALAALEAGRPLHRIWCTPELRFSPRFLQLLREAKASGVLLEEVTWARLGQISGGAVHQGIVLQPAAAATLQLDSLIEGCQQLGESPLLIAVDGLTDPQNLGAIARSAEALGAHGLVLPQRRNAGLTGSVAKVAAGALEHLPVARVVNLNRSLDALKQEGYRVIGLAAEGTVTLEEADLSGPLVLVTGSEAEGLSLLTRRSCDQLVRIPLRGATPSLNASVATALLLYEVARRSWMEGLRGTARAPRLVRPALPEPEPSPSVTAPPEAAGGAIPSAAADSPVATAALPEPAMPAGLPEEVAAAVAPAGQPSADGLEPSPTRSDLVDSDLVDSELEASDLELLASELKSEAAADIDQDGCDLEGGDQASTALDASEPEATSQEAAHHEVTNQEAINQEALEHEALNQVSPPPLAPAAETGSEPATALKQEAASEGPAPWSAPAARAAFDQDVSL